MNYIHSGSGGNAQFSPWDREFYTEWCNAVSHRTLLGVFDGLSCCSCLWGQCSWVYYGPLWSLSRDYYLQATCEYPSTSQKGSYHSWVHSCKDKETVPESQGLPFSYLSQHPAVTWGGSVLTLCTWVSTLHISSLSPEFLGYQHSNLSSSITCGYILPPRSGMIG